MKRKNVTILVMVVLFLVGCLPSSSAFAVHIVAWGANDEGQCDVPDANDFVAIAAADQHNLALNADAIGRQPHREIPHMRLL